MRSRTPTSCSPTTSNGVPSTQAVRTPSGASFLSNRRFEGGFYGGASAGWYWTEHLRTQVDAGIGTTARATRFVDRSEGTRTAFQTIDTQVRPATFAISQQYQFFHNAVFHPHVGAGLLVRSERVHEAFSPVTRFDPGAGQSIVVEAGHIADRSRTNVAALVDAGFKAYISRRAFFVTDARFMFRDRVDGVLFRFGFGLDF